MKKNQKLSKLVAILGTAFFVDYRQHLTVFTTLTISVRYYINRTHGFDFIDTNYREGDLYSGLK
jgi:hypothetical protein